MKPILYAIACVTPVVFLLAVALTVTPRSANATAAYAQQTGRGCGSCHVNKAGGGALTATGKAFVAAGHKMPGKKK